MIRFLGLFIIATAFATTGCSNDKTSTSTTKSETKAEPKIPTPPKDKKPAME